MTEQTAGYRDGPLWVRMGRRDSDGITQWGPWHIQDDYSGAVRTQCRKKLRNINIEQRFTRPAGQVCGRCAQRQGGR